MFCFCGFLFCTYELLSSSTNRKSNTAQHSTHQPCTKQENKYVPIRARQRQSADRVGESLHVVEHWYSLLCSKKKRRHRNLPSLCRPTKYLCLAWSVGFIALPAKPLSQRWFGDLVGYSLVPVKYFICEFDSVSGIISAANPFATRCWSDWRNLRTYIRHFSTWKKL